MTSKGRHAATGPDDFERPRDIETVLRILDERAGEARVRAGGQSLLPLSKSGAAQPAMIVDLGGIGGLDHITESDDGLRIGALVTHRRILESPWTAMLEETAAGIGDPQVRSSGTIGGSVAHADPASEWPAVLLALRAQLVCRSLGGQRVIGAVDFFLGAFTTALDATELLTEIRLPPKAPGGGAAYRRLERRPGDFPAVGVCARIVEVDGVITVAGIGLTAVPSPMAATDAEAALIGKAPTEETFAAAAHAAAAQSEPVSDAYGTADDKRARVRELTFLALRTAHERSVATARAEQAR